MLNKTQVTAEICKRSFYRFSYEAFKVLHNGSEWVDNWHIEFLCDKVQKEVERIIRGEERIKHLVINVPPRTLKSELFNVFLSAYVWTLKNDFKFISTSYSSRLSMKLSVKARIVIESDWYKEHFPDVILSKDNNTKIEYTTSTGGLRYCTSTGGSVTGEGADIVLIDDPQNPRLARSEVERANANDFLNETLRSRFDDPKIGMFIMIMQRLHENDNTGMVLNLEPEEWDHVCLPAEVSDNIKPIHLKDKYVDGLLFADRLSPKVLKALKRAQGSYGYSGQYEQLPSPADGGIIKGSWFTIVESIKDREFKHVDIQSLTWDFLFDTAYTSKQENDPSAMMAATYFEDNLYIREVDAVRMEFPELIKEIPRFLNRNGYTQSSLGYVEPKASGKSVVQHLKANTSINIIESETPTIDKVSRANAVAPFIQSGRVFLLKGNWNESFLNECNAFPNGSHDDKVDVLVMAIDELTQQDDFYFV